jgi:hypothetical protein
MAIVGLRALEVVDHEVATAGFYGGFKTLDRGQQVRQLFRPFISTEWNPAPPQSGGNLICDVSYLRCHASGYRHVRRRGRGG